MELLQASSASGRGCGVVVSWAAAGLRLAGCSVLGTGSSRPFGAGVRSGMPRAPRFLQGPTYVFVSWALSGPPGAALLGPLPCSDLVVTEESGSYPGSQVASWRGKCLFAEETALAGQLINTLCF